MRKHYVIILLIVWFTAAGISTHGLEIGKANHPGPFYKSLYATPENGGGGKIGNGGKDKDGKHGKDNKDGKSDKGNDKG